MDLFRIFRPSDMERRLAARIPFDMVIAYEKGAGKNSVSEDVFVKCMDLSIGGILFVAPDSFEEGSITRVTLPVPGSVKPLKADIEIIRVRQTDRKQFEMGGKFCGLKADDVRAIAKLVECYTRNSSPEI